MASYEVQTDGGTYQVDTEDAPSSIPWSDVPKNAFEDVKGIAKSGIEASKNLIDPANIWESAAAGSLEPTKQKLSGDFSKLQAMPGALWNEAKQTVTHPVETFKQHPVNTALNVGAVAAPLLGSLGETGEAAKLAETAGEVPKEMPLPEEISRVPPNPSEPLAMDNEVADILKKANQPKPPPNPETPQPTIDPISQKVNDYLNNQFGGPAKEVKDYISRGYEGFAKQPGAVSNVADYIQSKSQMMSLQQMGFTPGQIRNLGKTPMEIHNAERAIGQYGLDSGIVSPSTGLKGMIEKNHALLETTGKKIDAFRKAADSMGPAYQPGELLQAVKAKLDPIYQRGVTAESPKPRGTKGADSGSYLKALQDVEDAPLNHKGVADITTSLNKDATQANKMSQNPGPYTDVANAISEINNERIKAKLGPQNAAEYEKALREYGVNKKIMNGLKYKSGGEVKRFGPGSVTSNLTQKAMDEFGYKMGAKVANKVSTSIMKNPSIAKSLPSLFKEFINQAEDAGEEIAPH